MLNQTETNGEAEKKVDYSVMTEKTNKPEKLTTKDLLKSWVRWTWINEVPHTFDRMGAPAFLFGLMPSLKKLYKNKDMLAEAYQRHLLFFNTQCIWGGGTLTGITLSLEEARANELAEGKAETIDNKLINNTKVGLMGPLAGIGDAIDWGTLAYIYISIFMPWAEQGSAVGTWAPFLLYAISTFIYGFFFVKMGYSLGRGAAKEILSGSKMKAIINALGVLGLFMMGVMAANYVTVSSSLKFTIGAKQFIMQDILNNILPGLLPIITVGALYFYFDKKGLNIMKGLVYLTLILGVLAAIGIL